MDDTAVTQVRAGQKVPISGRYEQIDGAGRGTGAFSYLTAGDMAPANLGSLRLVDPIEPKHTTAASAVALRKVVKRFHSVMRNLADR